MIKFRFDITSVFLATISLAKTTFSRSPFLILATAFATLFFHSESVSAPDSNETSPIGFEPINWEIVGEFFSPIQVIQDLSPRFPMTISGITNFDSSAESKENEEKRIGPVPLPWTLFWIFKVASCSCHHFLASVKRFLPLTLVLFHSPKPIKPSAPRIHDVVSSKSVATNGSAECSPRSSVVIFIGTISN